MPRTSSNKTKRERKKLKDRIVEGVGLSDTTLTLLATRSRRRRLVPESKQAALKTDSVSVEVVRDVKTEETVKKEVSKAPIPETVNALFSTSPETVQSIRVQLGMTPKSHHLVDLHATYRKTLADPIQPEQSHLALNFAEQAIDELDDAELDPESLPVIEPFVQLRAVQDAPQEIKEIKKKASPKKVVPKQSVQPVPEIVMASQAEMFRWTHAHHWIAALRFGVVTAVIGLLVLGVTTWQQFSAQAAEFTQATKDAITHTIGGFGTNTADQGAVEKKNNQPDGVNLGVAAEDWAKTSTAMRDLADGASFLSFIPGVKDTLETMVGSTQSVSDALSVLASVESNVSGLHEAAGTVQSVAVTIAPSAKDPGVSFKLPLDIIATKKMLTALKGLEQALIKSDDVIHGSMSGILREKISGSSVAFDSIQEKITKYREAVTRFRAWLDAYVALAGGGDEGFRRYLVVFQNSAELRATGGFMGAIAEITFTNGNPSKIVFPPGGPYDLQGGPNHFRPAPTGLDLMRRGVQLQDANWWFDFPTSAQEMARIYRLASGTSVDGVIGVTADWLPEWLRVIGDVTIPDDARVLYPKMPSVLTPDTVLSVIQNTEVYAGAKDPKGPLAIVLRRIAEVSADAVRSRPQEVLPAFAGMLSQMGAKKDVQAYALDQDLENTLRPLGITGELKSNTPDVFGFVASTVGGSKDSHAIQTQVHRDISMNQDGSYGVTVHVNRSYPANAGKDAVVSFLRLYVPSRAINARVTGSVPPPIPYFSSSTKPDYGSDRVDSTLASDLESGGTRPLVIPMWSFLIPGATQELLVTYDVPVSSIASANQFRSTVWRQAGNDYTLSQNIALVPGSSVQYSTASDGVVADTGDHTHFTWNIDAVAQDSVLTLAW